MDEIVEQVETVASFFEKVTKTDDVVVEVDDKAADDTHNTPKTIH